VPVPPAPRPAAAPLRLGSNENPFPPLPGVLQAVLSAGERLNRYPDPDCSELRAALSRTLGVAREQIAVGPGSADLLHRLTRLVCGPGDEVVTAWRSYEGHPAAVTAAGARPVRVPLTADGRADLRTMAASCTGRTRAAFVCTPHNPTGTVPDPAELARFLSQVPAHVLVVLDEAYRDFAGADAPDGLAAFADRPALCVVRTFSKGYGLAGLRVGYLVADSALAERVRGSGPPYAVSQLAQDAAVESLHWGEALAARVGTLMAERTRMRSVLCARGWPVPESRANFLWLPLGERTTSFQEHCARAGVAVKAFPGEGARITVADAESNDLLLDLAREFGAGPPPGAPS